LGASTTRELIDYYDYSSVNNINFSLNFSKDLSGIIWDKFDANGASFSVNFSFALE